MGWLLLLKEILREKIKLRGIGFSVSAPRRLNRAQFFRFEFYVKQVRFIQIKNARV
jgi:hypothetical protein